MNEYVDLHGAN